MARNTTLARASQQQPQSLVQSAERPALAPVCDIYENKEEILLVADLPGVPPDSLTIQLDNGELTLEARRELPAQPASLLAAEYRDCDFRRRFVVPTGIDAAKINAELKDGVLRLHLPKSDALKPREIAVRTG